ncbi:14938_t:CDS:2 [Entrophospora sp. SA101]|nr:646_t:CDS:2 [Entrophospora sp. SA101]CAJ0641750.1 13048_t:CDS:2 [Entrophospora sp. SA101]CAJ0761756.1 14938_t:CDS:2 [Entrophospora sp. SA101]CAJ0882599.1 10672_t:CDS:2 [Entrophospora sp. SA101]CAJ0894862.1 7990_t:CDS:2 [Entrophospora sp. SA101]
MSFSKLYKLDKNKNLKDVKEESLEGQENELVRNIILKNFHKLFDYLELFNEGKPFSLPHGPKKRIPDSLAFCEKLGKRLYIFEYKSKIDRNIIDQTIKYRNALQENNDSGNNNLNHLRDHWIKAGERESKQEEIYLIEMSMYNLKNETLIELKGKHEEIINLSTITDETDKEHSDFKETGEISLLLSSKYKPRLTEEAKR